MAASALLSSSHKFIRTLDRRVEAATGSYSVTGDSFYSIFILKKLVFSEINPVLLNFISLRILPMESSSDSQKLKKNQLDFGLYQFLY